MNLDLKTIPQHAKDLLKHAQKYAWFAFVLLVLFIYTFLVFRIGQLSQAEPDESAVAEKSNTIKRLKIDEGALSKIQELQGQNVGVQALFEEARDNPFKDPAEE